MSTHWKLLVILAILLFLFLSGSAMLEAWLEIRKTPRKPMLWCGECKSWFAEEHAIQLFPELGNKIGNTKCCPSCYHRKVFIDPERKLV